MIRAQLTVLLVEDRPADAALIEGILARPGMIECALTWVKSLSDAIAHLDERDFDAAYSIYTEIARDYPTDPDTLKFMASIQRRRGVAAGHHG